MNNPEENTRRGGIQFEKKAKEFLETNKNLVPVDYSLSIDGKSRTARFFSSKEKDGRPLLAIDTKMSELLKTILEFQHNRVSKELQPEGFTWGNCADVAFEFVKLVNEKYLKSEFSEFVYDVNTVSFSKKVGTIKIFGSLGHTNHIMNIMHIAHPNYPDTGIYIVLDTTSESNHAAYSEGLDVTGFVGKSVAECLGHLNQFYGEGPWTTIMK